MERFTISKSEKQTIFEIYRACRLCGAGGGYRMPIIQNIVDFDDSNVELRQKIQDCLQLEVRADDRMPPLICELCVDKVNDFYKFMQLAQQTNLRTRTKLGLPLQIVKREDKVESDNKDKDSILGDTDLNHAKPAAKKGKAGPKCSKKKEEEPVEVKEEVLVASPRESRSSSLNRPGKFSKPATQPSRAQPKSTPKVTQQANTTASQPSRSQPTKTTKVTQVTHEKSSGKEKKGLEKDDAKETEIKKQTRISRKELANLLEDSASFEDNSLLVPRAQKRVREHEIPKPLIIPKRPKPSPKEPIKLEPPKEPTPPRPKPRPKSKQDPKNIPTPLKIPKKAKPDEAPLPPKVEPPKTLNCVVCNMQLKTVQAVTNHTRHHVPNYTKPQNACNPCAKWFATTEEANTHHRYHRSATFPYHCRRCFGDYRTLPEYDLHIANNKCVPWETVPDVKCEECWKTFPTDNLRKAHKCAGIDARPGGKCSNCSRTYATLRSLKKHEGTCSQRRKRDLIADPDVLRRLKPMQVRISRCDDLVADPGDYVDVSAVRPNYGLDRQYLYPYMKYKVKIKSTNKGRPKCKRDSYTHWDSEASDDDSTKVYKLSTLCIKKLFSKNLIGKVPRKRRKIKNGSNDFDSINNDISNIISSFEDDTESIEHSARNELLMASLNDIIGVPQEGNEHVVSNESYVTNDCNTTLDEKSEIPNQAVTEIVPESGGNDDVSMNENDGDTALTNDSVLNENETQSDTESLSKNTGPDDVDANENDVNDAEFEGKSEMGESETQGNAEDAENDNVLSNDNDVNLNDCNSAQEEKCDISNLNVTEECSKCTESSNVHSNEDVNAVFSENKEVLNQNDQYVVEDTGNEDVERNYVNTNESALNDDETESDVSNENSEDTSNVRLMGNEPVVSEENGNVISTNNSEEETEIALDETMHDKTVSSEVLTANISDVRENDNISTNNSEYESEIALDETMQDKTVSTEVLTENISDVSTKPHLEDSEHNDIEKDCDNEVRTQRELINNVENNNENATENIIESELVNNIGNDEESNRDETNSADLETNRAPLVDNEMNSTVNGINNHENETEQNDSKSNETESDKTVVNNVTNKESPIKHSIENIIGETDKNPQRYIEEVISSLENIIMKNPRNEEQAEKVNGDIKDDIEDQNLLDAIDAQIGEERKSDSDKITLDDLLPREDRSMELDDISDDDFDFDA